MENVYSLWLVSFSCQVIRSPSCLSLRTEIDVKCWKWGIKLMIITNSTVICAWWYPKLADAVPFHSVMLFPDTWITLHHQFHAIQVWAFLASVHTHKYTSAKYQISVNWQLLLSWYQFKWDDEVVKMHSFPSWKETTLCCTQRGTHLLQNVL